MSIQTITLQHATLTRVGYADVPVPPEAIGLSVSDVARIPWGSPTWAEGGQVRVGAATWFADIDGRRLAFDPVQAADDVLRADRATEAAHQAAIAQVFAQAGFARETVDLLVLTHIEGVGMVAWRNDDDSWSPYFPNARVLISDVQLREFVAAGASTDGGGEREAWQALVDQGLVDTFADGDEVAPGICAEVSGGHCAGHAVLHFTDGGDDAVLSMLGHLAVSPLHLATGECTSLHADPRAAFSLLHAAAADGRWLVGPLWPAPGYGRWVNGELVTGA